MSWNIINNKLEKEFKLHDFSEIIDKLKKLSVIADNLNHHPDFAVRNYNQIIFSLYTHDINAISEKDHLLSIEIDKLFDK